jgi:hypothetical protein
MLRIARQPRPRQQQEKRRMGYINKGKKKSERGSVPERAVKKGAKAAFRPCVSDDF